MNPRSVLLWTACTLMFLAGCSTLVATPGVPLPTAQEADAAWARVLALQVNDRGEVDFQALAQDPSDLDRYVRHVAAVPLESVPDGSTSAGPHDQRVQRPVHVQRGAERHSGHPCRTGQGAVLRVAKIRGRRSDDVAVRFRERRDPALRPRPQRPTRSLRPQLLGRLVPGAAASKPFTAEALDAELEHETRAFFARPENFRIDTPARTLWLSELLNFYPDDFVPRPAISLLDYANRYVPQPAPPDFSVRFMAYDWTVANSRRRPEAGP